jgi:hypothetical protein
MDLDCRNFCPASDLFPCFYVAETIKKNTSSMPDRRPFTGDASASTYYQQNESGGLTRLTTEKN